MITLPKLLRAAMLFGAVALLSACTIVSDALLVSDAEVVTPLPAKPFLFGYEQEGADAPFNLTDKGPLTMTLEADAYIASDGSLSVRFVPLDEPNTYLLAASDEDSSTYAVAHYAGSILEVRAVLGSDAKAAFEAVALPGVAISSSGYKVSDRAQLDQAIALVRGGTFEVMSLVFFIAESGDAAAPASIIRDGDWLKPAS